MVALRTIGAAARFFLTRHWQRSWVGPYLIVTVEARPGAYETTVTWGEAGPQVERFGSALAFGPRAANEDHEELCGRVERQLGARRLPSPPPPAA